jgi:hypothetical protein
MAVRRGEGPIWDMANWTFQMRIAILVVWCAEKSTSLLSGTGGLPG